MRALVSRITPPTATPSRWAGAIFTRYAANGAAIRPPASKAMAMPQWMPAVPRPMMNPRLAAALTANSEVSIEPITLRGSIRPSASSAGVATGPQPPPPVASTKPANRPSGARNFSVSCFFSCGRTPRMNRTMM